MPASPPNAPRHAFYVPRRALVVGAIAFGVGLLLFLMVWLAGRDPAPEQTSPADPATALSDIEPLPAPLPAGDGASDMPEAGAPSEPRPRLVEAPPPPAPAALAQDSLAIEQGPGPDQRPEQGSAPPPTDQPVPLRDASPPPRYPPAALRRRESGTVLLRVEVDASGRPAGIAVVQRSGSRDLDRAAQEAVRNWRFQPARREGQPAPGSLVIPIVFSLD